MKTKKLLFVLVVLVLAGLAVWINMRSHTDLPDGFTGGNGRMELKRLDVATLYAGRVIEMKVDEGDVVAKDQVLAELSSDQTSSRLDAARADKQRAQENVSKAEAEIAAQQQIHKVAQMDLDNARQLKSDELVSSPELRRRLAERDAAIARVKSAQAARAEALAAVQQAQAQINATSSANNDMLIRAPKAGRVEYRIAEAGNVLGEGNKVVSLLDPSDVTLSVYLPTDTIGKLKLGDEARIILDGMNAVWPAKVDFIDSNAQFTPKFVETQNERQKLMYKVKLKIPPEIALKYSGLLKGGLTGNGYIRFDNNKTWPQQWQVNLPSIKQSAKGA
ncbi:MULTISPECIES: HlyD family secretion protein [unclassified Snodgrassella]|uniref:HlyD family secretion protein n=1 Tax=unclassified Snodgrassella TaxID=2625236 RepID=UPI0018DE66EA|nr:MULTISPECIES: HlyD family efflux transporter periplasmic adaptor subunit [unclassified Snodgrassella]MBI0067402.1 HlyD family efflux transporter periplasmic adaptor subunit [Snodgrassella sp. M0110]MBI0076633.1 HlyD family efflux transporter periplasmic adaptor subunit [Snodgrassella sp. M0118]MBI0078703.1 HlyD family efflux transporter periplasmic adaptor subunit [Snodgrassella sp. M0112]